MDFERVRIFAVETTEAEIEICALAGLQQLVYRKIPHAVRAQTFANLFFVFIRAYQLGISLYVYPEVTGVFDYWRAHADMHFFRARVS